jgi:hypothetical protein
MTRLRFQVDLDERFAADMNAKVIPSFFACVDQQVIQSAFICSACNRQVVLNAESYYRVTPIHIF